MQKKKKKRRNQKELIEEKYNMANVTMAMNCVYIECTCCTICRI